MAVIADTMPARALAAVAGILVAAGVATAPAVAEPAVPPNCAAGQALYCDQPIEADGSWIRCYRTRAIFMSRGRYLPAVQRCVRASPDSISIGPPYHIGDSQ